MYFVDRKKISQTLTYLDSLLTLVEENNSPSTTMENLAFERIAQNVIESMIDVGNSMIDGFIMRDPGSYEDIVDILLDESVISQEMSNAYKEVLSLRKMLVRDFIQADHSKIDEVLRAQMNELKQFSVAVTNYLENELGPVSAFIPEDKK